MVPIFAEHWGEGNCNFTPILPYFHHWGMNLDHDFVQVSKLNEDQKKVFTKNGTLFFPKFKWTPTLRCTPESNYWRECRCRPYSNYWGDTVKLLGEIYFSHFPLVSATLVISTPSHMLTFSNTEKVRVNLLTSNSTTFA